MTAKQFPGWGGVVDLDSPRSGRGARHGTDDIASGYVETDLFPGCIRCKVTPQYSTQLGATPFEMREAEKDG